MSKKLLILGSDYGTLDLVREAHRMGVYVIVTDTMKTSPTKQAADEAWLISTTDLDELEAKCREVGINAVSFGASDFNITNGRKLCNRLGLPYYCSNDYAWKVACDKSEFKKICKKVGAPIATDYHLSDELTDDELDKVVFPVVVKPVDKSGNRGMSYCNNKDELIAAYKYARSVSSNGTIIVERELKGPEFAVNYLMANGEPSLLYFCSEHHQPGQPNNVYSIMNTTSAYLKDFLEEANEKVMAVIKESKCTDGLVWIECFKDQDGHFYLIEMGYRFGGEMAYGLYERVSGINSIRWMLEVALGEKHTANDLPKPLSKALPGMVASYFLFSTVDGDINNIEGLEQVENLENVVIDFPKRVGNTVRKGASLGIIRIYGKDGNQICDTLEFINNNLSITDERGVNMFIRYTDYETLISEYNLGLQQFNG